MKTKSLLLWLMLLVGSVSALGQQPYVVLSPDNLTLTFYYDTNINSRSETTYSLNEGYNIPQWYEAKISVTEVEFDPSFANARPTSCYSWFSGMSNLTTIIGIENLMTDDVTNMNNMFANCYSLKSLDVSGFNTENVTDMNSMFDNCSSLKSLDVSGFNTAKVTDMSEMFRFCSSLTSLDVSGFNTANVTDMNCMFNDDSGLRTLDLSSFTFDSITDSESTKGILAGCSALTKLSIPADADDKFADYACLYVGYGNPCILIYPEDAPPAVEDSGEGWYIWKGGYFRDVPKPYAVLSDDKTTLTFYYDALQSNRTGTVCEMNTGASNPEWYSNRSSVTSVEFDPSFADARPTNCRNWFAMSNLNSITGLEYLNTSEVTDMMQMFYSCPLESIDVSHFDTSKVRAMGAMFYKCKNLKNIDVSNFDTSNVDNEYAGLSMMFFDCSSLTMLDLSKFTISTDANNEGMLNGCSSLEALTVPSSAVHLPSTVFDGVGTANAPCTLTYPSDFTITPEETGDGWYKWKSGYFKDGPKMYTVMSADMKTLTFYYDENSGSRPGMEYHLNSGIYLPEWYASVESVTSVVFDSSFADARPTSCVGWFYNMVSLTTITGIEYLNTEKVTDMEGMFDNCSSLKSLDVSGFNTENVIYMDYMFYYCSSLTSLDVSKFNTRKVTSMYGMFTNCSGLTSLDVNGFDTSNVIDMMGMFRNCSSLTSLDLSSFTFIKDMTYDYFLDNCNGLQTLTIPDTADNLAADAFNGVGTETTPCALNYPFDFSFTPEETGDGWYKWKGGYFRDVPKAYAAFDGSTLTFYFGTNYSSHTETLFELNSGYDKPEWIDYGFYVTHVVFDPSFTDARPTSCRSWFSYFTNLISIAGLEYLNTSEVTNMAQMFDGCPLESINVSHFDTSKVRDMGGMFRSCKNLKNINLRSFDTRNVADKSISNGFYIMFYNCTSLTKLDLSKFTFSPGVNSECMLLDCSALERLIVPSTADNLYEDTFEGVGTENAPCSLIYPDGTTLTGVTQYSGFYTWKSGYFKDPEAEPYAVLSTNGKTLTFYYDEKFGRRPGTMFDMNTEANSPEWHSYIPSVTRVVFDPSFADARPTSCYYWFRGMSSLTTITGIEYLNTDNVTNMRNMFHGCSSLTSIDLSGFNTASVNNMSYMFYGCSGLTSIDLSDFNTASVASMSYMFYGCSGLTSIDLSNFNTASVAYMSYMFYGGSGLTSIDLSRFTFRQGVVANSFLAGTRLENLIVSNSANNLPSGAFVGVGTTTSACTLIYPSGFTPSNTTQLNGYFRWKGGYFQYDPKPYAVLSTNGKTLTFYYDSRKDYRGNEGTTYDLKSVNSSPDWFSSRTTVEAVNFTSSFKSASPTSCYNWFAGMQNLRSINGMEYLKTNEVRYMTGMFDNCSSLKSLDLSGFNTAKVTSMASMFRGCSSLTSLDLSGFTFSPSSSTSYTSYLLYNCTGLESLTLPISANYIIASDAFYGVGTAENPCTLIYPDGFTPNGATPHDGFFYWKGGFFKTNGLPGDANDDGNVSVADVMLTVNKAMNKPVATFNEKNADINNDGRITVADVMGIVKLVLSSGPKSAPRNAFQSMSDAMAVTAKGNELTLHLTGTGSYTASQMTLTLPEGCRLESAQMVSSRSNGHSVLTNDLGNGQYRVVVYGATGLPFGNSCSDLVRLNVKGNHNGDVAVSDIQVVDYLTNTFLLSDVSGIATGIDSIGSDASDDGDWYTTQGQKVATPTRGVYIRNGRKVVVR